jgi:SAM-dependent methyltransferase
MIDSNYNWHTFWSQYRNIDYQSESDLFVQVGKTIHGAPISNSVFIQMIEDIVTQLELSPQDTLVDMCCGNGLLTLPISEFVRYIYAFDFTEHLIATAKQHRSNTKIHYAVADANRPFINELRITNAPQKYLMNDSLGYFNTTQLSSIIKHIQDTNHNFKLYVTGVPDDALKFNFYNTDERKRNYYAAVASGEASFQGIGKWWPMHEIVDIADTLNVKIRTQPQPNCISNYRSNVLIWN